MERICEVLAHAAAACMPAVPKQNGSCLPSIPDCQTCGACCANPQENRDEGFADWVEIDPRDLILARPRHKHLVVLNAAGEPHMRLDPAGRCAALRGRLGQRVHCAIYDVRPRACRRLEAGSPRCLAYREERGFA
ncbi:MAG: YkgJ family cysteine cluster protein [Myxococcales bacterium]|nr:YkgJ family cysteine cluster protein [Myxococcales bacterium]